MISLFRRNRQGLFTQNKLLSYLFYAIGEILLVVIGILIALYINNKSEANKHEEKVKTILREVQGDLLLDIEHSIEVFQFYQQRDSLIELVFSGKLKPEDYKGKEGFLYLSLTISLNDFQFHDNGFANLMRNTDIIPDRFGDILNQLKRVYINDKKRIETNFEAINKFAMGMMDMHAEQHAWFSDMARGKVTDEVIEYHMHDPFYKNDLMRFQIIATSNLLPVLQDFQHEATEAYSLISEEITPGAALPALLSEQNIAVSEDILHSYVGTYKVPEGLEITVTTDGQRLYLQASGQSQVEVFARSDTQFHNPVLGATLSFNLTAAGEVKSFLLNQGGKEMLFQRK